jgi:hypothetical protein
MNLDDDIDDVLGELDGDTEDGDPVDDEDNDDDDEEEDEEAEFDDSLTADNVLEVLVPLELPRAPADEGSVDALLSIK